MQFSLTVSTLTFFAGLGLITLGIFGGGVEIQKVKIPPLAVVSRILSVVAGMALVILYIGFRDVLDGGANPPNSKATTGPQPPQPKSEEFRGRLIENGTITVREVKIILRSLGHYNGTIDEDVSLAYKQALQNFQHSQNIGIDGYVGPITYARLRDVAPQFFESISKTQPNDAVKTGISTEK